MSDDQGGAPREAKCLREIVYAETISRGAELYFRFLARCCVNYNVVPGISDTIIWKNYILYYWSWRVFVILKSLRLNSNCSNLNKLNQS